MSHIIDPFSGSPAVHHLLGRLWTSQFSCVRFVSVALDLPYVDGGKWGAILSRPSKLWKDAREGDIIVWPLFSHPGAFVPVHAALYIDPFTILNNGYTRGGHLEDAHVCYARCYSMGLPELRLHEGKALQ